MRRAVFEHVGRHGVGAQANQHVLLGSWQRCPRSPPRCSSSTEDYERPRFAFETGFQLPAIHMHTMRGYAPGAQDAEPVQPLHYSQVVLLPGSIAGRSRPRRRGYESLFQSWPKAAAFPAWRPERKCRMKAEEGRGGWLIVDS